MKKELAMATCAFVAAAAVANDAENACSVQDCPAGTHGVTYSSKAEPFYTCPTRELSSYTELVIGLISMSGALGLPMPNISDKTGEPEYLDGPNGPNKTRLLLEMYRRAAGVETFDEALSMCTKGSANQKVVVMNNPKDSSAIWVMNPRTQKAFWMSKAHLDKK